MKALVTGIEGFVGPYLAEVLLKEGFDVYGTYLLEWKNPIKEVKKFYLDVTDKKKTAEVISKVKPDWIINLAGFSSVAQSWKKPELCHKVNVDGVKNLLDAVLAAGISPKILVVSSAEVYGKPQKIPIKEDHPLNPDNPYAKSRVEQEKVVLDYVKNKGIKAVISRSFNHTGPGQLPTFVCSDFANQIARIEKGLQEPVIKTGDLSVKRDFSDVRDIVKAYVLALEKCKVGEIYNLCSGKAYYIKEILDILISFSKKKDIKVVQDADKVRPVDVPVLVGDNGKFVKDTGWNGEIGFENTLKNIVEWWRHS